MYCIIYRFTLCQPSPETAARFVEVWSGVTDYFKRECGALGSRLHRADDGVIFAYAQWPSEDIYNATDDHEPKQDFVKLRVEWAGLCEPTEVIFAGEVVADMLVQPDQGRPE